MSVSNIKSCRLLEQYLSYLSVMKGRSENTIDEYRNDLAMFFRFVKNSRIPGNADMDMSNIDIEFIQSITIHDMYCFIAGPDREKKLSPSTRARRIVSIRQFWKYLKTKVHLIDNNIAEELETPKIPKRIPRYLNLEDSIRLLIKCEDSIRNHCILTVFLNCALRLSESTNIDIDQINGETLSVIGKGAGSKGTIKNLLTIAELVCHAIFYLLCRNNILFSRFIKAFRLILYELFLKFYFQANYQLLFKTILINPIIIIFISYSFFSVIFKCPANRTDPR